MKPEFILGISAFYHDSAAALLIDGDIVAAAQEERFTRIKHDPAFPKQAVEFVLEQAGITLEDVSYVVFYDKPLIKFERLLETYHRFAPSGLLSFLSSMPVWIKEKLFLKKMIREELKSFGTKIPTLLFPEHHLSHGASAFYPSPFQDAAILTLDGVGEWATTTIGHGKDHTITLLKELHFPHSLGLLYSSFTYYCGFRVNSGEYKLMGLAPYGDKDSKQVETFKKKILDTLVDVRDDGSFLLNMAYFRFATGLKMCDDKKWETLFGLPKRQAESELSQSYMNLALAIQMVTEEIVLKLAQTAKKLTGSNHLVLSGGVALNCVANGKLLKAQIFDDIWIQPASGDAGGALGAALAAWHIFLNKPRDYTADGDSMKGAYLGPDFSDNDIQKVARKYQAPCESYDTFESLCDDVANVLSDGMVVGWFQGPMEFGPRALGNRSILGNPCLPEMQKKLNLKIKYREGFRPFAPIVLEEHLTDYFDISGPSPYMLLVAPVKSERRTKEPDNFNQLPMYDRLYHVRSDVPAITHVDYSARIQSVSQKKNAKLTQLLESFKQRTGHSILVNTSFNVRGEPIVCTPEDAYRCFMRTEMDYLVMGNVVFNKKTQPEFENNTPWQEEFRLD